MLTELFVFLVLFYGLWCVRKGMSQKQNTVVISSSQESQHSQSSNNDGFSTPKQYRHKRLEHLINNDGSRSPAFCIPASPVMQRLGYGTGKLHESHVTPKLSM
jgi:hypothetical protein